MVKKLRSVARGCLWKHLIFSFRGDLNEDYPMAMVSYGTIFRINSIDSTSLPVIREWIRKHAKIGAAGEGRVFGDGTYTLLQVHTADIVTEIEDSEICPGNDTIDATKFTYFDLPLTWSPIQYSTSIQPVGSEPIVNDDVMAESQVGNPSRATIQEILNRHNSLTPSPAAISASTNKAPTPTPTHNVPVVEILDQGQDLVTILPTEKSSTTLISAKHTIPSTKMVQTSTKATSTTTTPTSKMHIILAEGKTIGPTTTTLSTDEVAVEEPVNLPEEIVNVEPEARDPVLEEVENLPTTILPTTTSSMPRLIVGTPPADTAQAIYSLDDNYDGSLYQSFDSDSDVDLEVAKQETLVEIKKSESFWAFLSCAVLIIGKSTSEIVSSLFDI